MRLLKGLSSLRLTIGLLLWLVFMCILGTVIPQLPVQATADVSMATHVAGLLSLKDVFHSLWFLVPTIILGLNAAACMYLWRRTLERYRAEPPLPRAGLHEITMRTADIPEKVCSDFKVILAGTHKTVQYEDGGDPVIMGENGRVRVYAPFIVHAGIILILLGAGLGFLGYKGTIEIPVGQESNTVTLANGSIMHLPFRIKCEDFKIDYYENGMPSEYRSELTFVQDNDLSMHTSVLVNHPASHGGILFSQSGFNQNPVAALKVGTPSGTSRFRAAEGLIIRLKDTGYNVRVDKVAEDLMRMGPCVHLVIETPDAPKELWIFKEFNSIAAAHPGLVEKMPQLNPSLVTPYTFSLEGVTNSYATVLGINRDPGIVFVGLGSMLFLIGIIISFMVVHERVLITATEAPSGLVVKIARMKNGKPAAPEKYILEQEDSSLEVRS
ncbi:MAG TPA: cytochrome c biogenesis protein ResB [Desulfomonilia bacterium]|nr:cytochrome c biogenesis protein ResB [Desulfomonilia bacterium]